MDKIIYNEDGNKLVKCPEDTVGEFFIPEEVTEICDGAFYGCSMLESVCIPPSVTKIGKMAFAGCNGLRKITVERAVPPTVESNAFDGVDKSIYIEVSFFDSVEDYKKAEGWKEFENIKPYVFGDLSEI